LGATAFALQYGGTCWAANLTAGSLAARGAPAPGGCTSACLSDASQTCGGPGNAVSVYLLGAAASSAPPEVRTSASSSAAAPEPEVTARPQPPTECQRFAGYRFRSQTNVPGHNLLPDRAASASLARAQCDAHPGCLAFNTGGLIKSAMGPLEAWPAHAHGYGDPCTGVYVRTTPNLWA
jgi:hypothetical protein